MGNPAKWVDPNYTDQNQTGTSYPLNIDASFAAAKRLANDFCPHQQDQGSPSPDLTIRVEAGAIWVNGTLTEIDAQTVSGFTVPTSGQHRIDRVVLDPTTGVCSRVAGTAVTGSPSAVAPAITAGSLPICSVLITSSDSAIVNSMITDERRPYSVGLNRLVTEQASTSGTTVDFTGIPPGVKEIVISLVGVSTGSTSALLVQIGDSGGVENTGYVSGAGTRSAETTSTAGFVATQAMIAANAFHGRVVLTLEDSSDNTWVASGTVVNGTTGTPHNSAGSKSLSAELDRVRITTVSGDTFDAGAISISYRR